MSQFDLHMNYYLDSDIVTGYWSGKQDEWFTPPVKKVRCSIPKSRGFLLSRLRAI